MTILHSAVNTANQQGKLALMIYTIPNFPDPETYQQTLDVLYRHPDVSIIETTFPVTAKYSEFANQTIRSAHQQAARHVSGLSVLEQLQPFKKPSVCVLYQQTLDDLNFESLLQKIQGKINGVLLEWEENEISPYASLSKQDDIELIQVVYPGMTSKEMDKYLGLTEKEPIIYLVSAAMTGGDLFTDEELIECIRQTKACRPESKLMVGFGIKNTSDIHALAQLEGLDGIIIGTAFLQTMRQGIRAVETFLDNITPALTLPGRVPLTS
uniref:tryptophan synthase n=1 Tax=Candidatus Kentrum sp. UNK TaxID=2126344 RepID=A0A451B599_9GAMM|nr:MAG: tryptophan synthase, alpha chain [Candidatus Kentron sp. UNK]VFK73463.1 MAG: tryptophan synthase, alpha chain [Candidatus Kentron sp. UNK]